MEEATFDEVEKILGKPKTILRAEPKTIYVYEGMKIIFVDGNVADRQ